MLLNVMSYFVVVVVVVVIVVIVVAVVTTSTSEFVNEIPHHTPFSTCAKMQHNKEKKSYSLNLKVKTNTPFVFHLCIFFLRS